jgi:nucleolar protein TMA23
MDAHALLTSQGWRGYGHSLHPTSDNTGLTRPLMVSSKPNNHGVGKKHHTSDMWWLNAFDASLKGLDTSTEGKVVQTVTSGGLDMVKKGGARFVGNGGLYSVFVKGEGLEGTILRNTVSTPGEIVEEEKKESSGDQSKQERRARKLARRATRAAAAALLEGDVSTPTPIEQADNEDEEISETKEQRRERRRLKRIQREAEGRKSTNDSESTKKPKKKRRKE